MDIRGGRTLGKIHVFHEDGSGDEAFVSRLLGGIFFIRISLGEIIK